MGLSLQPSGWLRSAKFDLLVYSGPIWLGLLLGFFWNERPEQEYSTSLAIFIFLGLSHFGVTWLFYFDAKNRDYFSKRRWEFYLAPLAIVIISLWLLRQDSGAEIVAILTYWISGWHVMKQSYGFVCLYRKKVGDISNLDRKIDYVVIVGASMLFLIGRYAFGRTDFGYETIFSGPWMTPLFEIVSVAMFFLVVWWCGRLFHQSSSQNFSPWPLFSIGMSSILMFSSYIYVHTRTGAIMASITGHYIQYLGLCWSINRQKYTSDPNRHFLRRLSGNSILFFGVLLIYAGLFWELQDISPWFPATGLLWSHLYLDRNFFQFRDPYIRSAILTPLLRSNQ